MSKDKTFIFSSDISGTCAIEVVADTMEEALSKLDSGELKVMEGSAEWEFRLANDPRDDFIEEGTLADTKTEPSSEQVANKINLQAHNNCIKQLHRANERIVEFEDLKKGHLIVLNKLKKQLDIADQLASFIKNKVPPHVLHDVCQQDRTDLLDRWYDLSN